MKKNSQFLARSSFSNILYGDTPFGREMNKNYKKNQAQRCSRVL